MADSLPSVSAPMSSAPTRSYESGPGIIANPSDRVVGYAIRCWADFKIGDREFSGAVDLHEVVCLRRKYEEMGGGSVTLRPDWKPALERLTPLKQEQLTRTLEIMRETFTVARQSGGVLDVLSLFYGTEPGAQLTRLHEVLRLQLEAWGKLVDRALTRIPSDKLPRDAHYALVAGFEMITPKELEDIARIADPASNDEGNVIELPAAAAPAAPATSVRTAPAAGESLGDMQARAGADADASGADNATLALVARLTGKADLNQQQALAVATLVELMEGAEIPDTDLSDAIGSKAKVKLDAVRRALKP